MLREDRDPEMHLRSPRALETHRPRTPRDRKVCTGENKGSACNLYTKVKRSCNFLCVRLASSHSLLVSLCLIHFFSQPMCSLKKKKKKDGLAELHQCYDDPALFHNGSSATIQANFNRNLGHFVHPRVLIVFPNSDKSGTRTSKKKGRTDIYGDPTVCRALPYITALNPHVA